MTSLHDCVDEAVEDFAREMPELDVRALGVMERIQRIAIGMRRQLDSSLAPTGVRLAGFGVLAALRRTGRPYELKPSELSRETMLTTGAMTSRLDRLEDSGLVERRRPRGADRRTVLIRLTPAGRSVVEKALPIYCEELGRLIADLDRKDLKTVEHVLRRIAVATGDDPSR